MMKRNVTILALLVLALGARARAQVAAGEASLNLNGVISAGYGDDSSNVTGSDHSIFGAGQANLTGFYYNPNFISFNVEPFYNQSWFNSTYQSMTAASGVSASARIFSGSPFPGSISYSTTFNSSGNFGIPGLANYTTHGKNDNLALSWGEHLKDWPSLNVSYANATNSYSVYGAESLGTLHFDTFSATSAYQIAGFNLNGGYQHSGTHSITPEFLTGESALPSSTDANSFFLGVGHGLPWNGGFSGTATHMKLNTGYGDTGSNAGFSTSIDTLTGALNFGPTTHLNVGASGFYTDNLEGTLYNTLLTAGVVTPQSAAEQSSHALNLTGTANYLMPDQHLVFHALFNHEQQTFMGSTFSSDSYNGTATYSNQLLGGFFNGVLGLTRTSVSSSHQGLLGLNASINYSHPVQSWNLAGGFTYSQNTQTVLIAYTTSGYSYFGTVGRRIHQRMYWGASGSGSRSLLTGQPGTANSSQSYSTSFSLPRFSINGSYSKSSGNSLLTTTGLVTTPIPVTVVPSSAVVLFNGNSYSVGLGSSPVRGLTLSASYAKALSTTNSNSTLSNNNNETMYFLMVYNFRKLAFNAGYSRMVQAFTATGGPPAMQSSFFVGVSRWFNFF
jgi:hypothetical protein